MYEVLSCLKRVYEVRFMFHVMIMTDDMISHEFGDI